MVGQIEAGVKYISSLSLSSALSQMQECCFASFFSFSGQSFFGDLYCLLAATERETDCWLACSVKSATEKTGKREKQDQSTGGRDLMTAFFEYSISTLPSNHLYSDEVTCGFGSVVADNN